MRHFALLRGLVVAVLLALYGCGGAATETTEGGESPDGGSQGGGFFSRITAPPPVVVEAGTPIEVTIDQRLSSETHQPGDRFEASVAAPVVVGDKVVIPAGSRASGTVTASETAGRVRGSALLSLRLDSVTVGGETYDIQTGVVSREGGSRGERTAIGAGAGAAAGAVIGAIAGGGRGAAIGAGTGAGAGTAGAVLTGERDITIPAETRMRFTLSEAVSVRAN